MKNKEWLFIGVGLIVVILVMRHLKSRQETKETVSADGTFMCNCNVGMPNQLRWQKCQAPKTCETCCQEAHDKWVTRN